MGKIDKLKRSSHPVMFFIYLSLLVILISGIANALNLQVTYDKLTTILGEAESNTVSVNSLLSLDGLRFLISNVLDNLKTFTPFSSFLISSIAFAIAYKSGFLKSLCAKITKKIPKYIIVFVYALLCILSSVDANLGYVLLVPFGAVLFMSMGRNPIGGLVLGFTTIAASHGAGFFVTALDYNLSSYTESSARLSVDDYVVNQSSNIIFIIVIAILTAIVVTIITEKILVRKLGKNQIEDQEEIILDEKEENKGLIACLITFVIYLVPFVLMIIPSSNDGFIGLLLDKSQTNYVQMIFSSNALFMTNLVGIISLLFAILGFVFGVVSGTIKKVRDAVNYSSDYLKEVGGMFLLIFFASQLIAILEETNIGVVVTGFVSNLISQSNFSFLPLILIILILTAIVNIIFPSSVSKWAIFAPSIVPVAINANISPEFAQIVYRAGDSITNSITPFFVYFVIFIGFVEIYTKNKNEFSVKKCYKLIIPYFISISLIWLCTIILWYIAGFPIASGIYPVL